MSPSTQCTVLSAGSFGEFLGIMEDSTPDQRVLVHRSDALTLGLIFGFIRSAKGIASDKDGSIWPGSSWSHARAHWQLPEDAAQEAVEATAYFADEYHTQEAQVRFALDPVVRMARFGLTREMIHDAAKQWPVRDGVPELFGCFEAHEIAIISYGLYDPIRAWLIEAMKYDPVSLPVIYALRMLWDESGRLIGPDRTTVVTDKMKVEALQMHAAQLGVASQQLITIGDSPSDEFIKNGIGIAVVPHEKVEGYMSDIEGGKRESHRLRGLEKLWNMSCAVALGSLLPIAQIRRGEITA